MPPQSACMHTYGNVQLTTNERAARILGNLVCSGRAARATPVTENASTPVASLLYGYASIIPGTFFSFSS